MGAVSAAAPTIFRQWVQTMYFCTQNILEQNTLFIVESLKISCPMNKFRNTRVNVAVKIATNTQKASDTGFITASYCFKNFGITSPERYRERQILDFAPCSHNVPDAPTPMASTISFSCKVTSIINTHSPPPHTHRPAKPSPRTFNSKINSTTIK